MRHRLALNTDLSHAIVDGVAPTSVELIPSGPTIVGRDGRTWMFDALAATNVIDAFAQRGIDIAIDRNHALELKAPQGEESPAAAWIDQLELRDGALWGHVTWTPRGADQVGAREYRYLSPVFDYEPDTGRIARLVSVGLVNKPNLRLTALNHEDTQVTLSAAMALALGLSTDATDEVAVAAVTRLKTAINHENNLERFVPRADYDAVQVRAVNAEQALSNFSKAEHSRAVDADIDAALKAGKITPATADYHRASCSDASGLERFRAYVTAAPVIAPDTTTLDKKPQGQLTALNAEERQVIQQLGLTEDQFRQASAKAREQHA